MLDNSGSMNYPIREEDGTWVEPHQTRMDLLKQAVELMLTGGDKDGEHIDGVNNVNVGLGRFAVKEIKERGKKETLVNAPIMFPVSFVDGKLEEIAGEEENNILDVSAPIADSSDDAEQNLGTGETNLTNPQLQMTQAVVAEPSSGVKAEIEISTLTDTAMERLETGQLNTKDDLILGTDPSSNLDILVGLRFQRLAIPKGAKIDYANIAFASDGDYENQNVDLTIAVADNDGASKPKDASSVGFGNRSFKNNNSTKGYLSGKGYPEDKQNFPLLKDSEENPVLVKWKPPTDLVEGQVIKTPDISDLIRGIVNRDGWSDNNSIVLLIQRPVSPIDDSSTDPDTNIPPGDNIGVYALSTPPVLRVYWTFDETKLSQVSKEQAKESDGSFDTKEIRLGNEKQQQGSTLVGVRFTKVAVPPGAKISDAKITFTRQSEKTEEDEAGNQEPLNLKIYAEDIGDAIPFRKEELLPRSQRPTEKSVEWNDVEMVDVGEVLTTPNLNEILQQIIDRPDWQKEKNIVFLFEKNGDVNGFRRVVARGDNKRRNGGTIKPGDNTYPKLEITFSAGLEQDEVDPQNLKQIVGLRFTKMEIPQGAEITSAKLTFTSSSSTSEPANLIIQTENVDDAKPFAEKENNISSRETTTEKVKWKVEEEWIDGRTYTSPELKELVQAVVDREGWCGGRNGMVFIITAAEEDNPLRIARSFDDRPDRAPILTVQFDMKKINGNGCVDQSYMGQIVSGSDNAEEKLEPPSERGNVNVSSRALELGSTGNAKNLQPQLVGLRFQGIPIAKGVEIAEAHLTFHALSDSNKRITSAVFNIAGELSPDAEEFLQLKSDLSERNLSQPVPWVLTEPWQKNKFYQSVDISSIVQEIVNQANWEVYNSMAFIIKGTGQRRVTSFKNPALAPILTIRIKGRFGEEGETDLTVRQQLRRITKKMEIPEKSWTAITDALYEGVQYFSGAVVDLGKTRHGFHDYLVSHPGTYSGGELKTPTGCNVNLAPLDENCADEEIQGTAKYTSPVESVCQANHLVLLTDGLATKNTVTDKIAELTGIGTEQDCQKSYPDPEISGENAKVSSNEMCALDLAKYVSTHDILTQQEFTQGEENIGGNTLTIHTIGFQLGTGWKDGYYVMENGEKREVYSRKGKFYYSKRGTEEVDLEEVIRGPIEDDKVTQQNESARKFLKQVAAEGGGYFYEAINALDLVSAFKAIIMQALTESTSFAAPGISVSQFNNLFHDKEVYYALFKPNHNQLWEGNVKKFIIEGDKLKDTNGNDASDGKQFNDKAQSFWSNEVDGDKVTKGGAGEQLLELSSAQRKIYTYLGETPPGSNHDEDLSKYQIQVNSGDKDFDQALRSALKIEDEDNFEEIAEKTIRWIIGENVNDQVGDNAPPEGNARDRWMFADPLHSSPKAITYGGTHDESTTKLFVGTNDGLLHMLDANSGKEEWAYLPQELLPKQPEMMENQPGDRIYGLDSSPTFWYKDDDGNKQVDVGTDDFLRLYIGMRRGGRNFYALDITNPQQPKLMWTIKGGTGDFVKLGQTWSLALPVEVDPNFCYQKDPCIVLVFGGGYDISQDSSFDPKGVTMGNAIFMVDAETGELLWWASKKDTDDASSKDVDLDLQEMEYPITADLFPVDSNGDDWIDRLYAADTGGQIWRIDFQFEETGEPAHRGDLRAKISSLNDKENHRRFFYSPVWAKVGKYELVVAITGTRPEPLGTDIADKFYVFNDLPFDKDDKLQTWNPLAENHMINVTDRIMGDQSDNNEESSCMDQGGWYIDLSLPGEKGLTTPKVVNDEALFTTYIPDLENTEKQCSGPSAGSSWLYSLKLSDCGGKTERLDNKTGKKRGNNVAMEIGMGLVDISILVRPEDMKILGNNGMLEDGPKNPFQRTFWMQQNH
jgi:type IV pilus assembly protein PilY1